ncbi:hypothetical protein KC951_03215 [Candidatus Saccharibacteria bacterium]|nr:hypothetical protein [Candidatus Saccharibacteria bacterium]
MNLDILQESLNLAIDGLFEVEATLSEAIAVRVSCMDKYGLDQELERVRREQRSGLKVKVVAGLCSGDTTQIKSAQEIAQKQAVNGVVRECARTAIRNLEN